MIRLLGCTMLLFASSALGFGAAAALKERVRELEGLILSLKLMELELSNKRTPLPELLQQITNCSTGKIKLFFELCHSKLINNNCGIFSEIWRSAVEESNLHIRERELLLLKEVGNILGRYDAESQCIAIRDLRERFWVFQTEANEQYSRMGSVYSTLGITGGSLLMIVLL